MRAARRRTFSWAGLDRLEPRALLSAGAAGHARGMATASPFTIPGNSGLILRTQLDPAGNPTVGSQWRRLVVGGPITIAPTTAVNQTGPAVAAPFVGKFNLGLIANSQVVRAGFPPVGLQLDRVRLGGGLTVGSYDDSDGTAATDTGSIGSPRGLPLNTGDILKTQLNANGFGVVGVQLDKVNVGGNLTVLSRVFVRNPVSEPVTSTTAADAVPVVQAQLNSGLIKGSQVNVGGFGDNGLQWLGVKVGGSVDVGVEKYDVFPVPASDDASGPNSALNADLPTIDTVNSGVVRDTQLNVGGFGDIGLQWSGVDVRKNVGTSDNNLSIQPTIDHLGPVTVDGLTLGQAGPAASGQAVASSSTSASTAVTASAAAKTLPVENDAFNSGRIAHSQVSDGGFGDVGLQWKGVAVGGGVSVVHNSLSVQPENNGQGLITVNNVQFPSAASPLTPDVTPTSGHPVAPRPKVVARDGKGVAHTLSTPTTPNSTRFQESAGTNTGVVRGSQFSDGGFGDVGLQWMNVKVGHDVSVVHNSLSVHPEGSGLAGVNVSNVTFGDPLPAATVPDFLSTLSPGLIRKAALKAASAYKNNDLFLDHQQVYLGTTTPPDVLIRWNHVTRNGGLVIVHNRLSVPLDGSVTLSDIKFLGGNPTATIVTAARLARVTGESAATVKNYATNSGTIRSNQFSDGGTLHDDLQWRDVTVSGSVSVVHNTLSVNEVNNPAGPVNISGVTFDSGTLAALKPADLAVVSPPDYVSKIPGRPVVGKKIHHDPSVIDSSTNSGILDGGQFQVDVVPGHVKLQWLKTSVHGSVTVVDNTLTVTPPPAGSGPITINNVTFA